MYLRGYEALQRKTKHTKLRSVYILTAGEAKGLECIYFFSSEAFPELLHLGTKVPHLGYVKVWAC